MKSVKIFPGAQVIGDVELGENVSVWHGAVIRGDVASTKIDDAPIKIGNNSNVQDNCVLHASKDMPVVIGENVSIGHAAVVHGCTIDDNVLIGMNATVLDGSHISKNSIVGAGAVVGEDKEFPEGSLIVGVPAKVVKQLTEEQIQHVKNNAKNYVELSQKYDD
jgi:carbonic anhydrase/acetyltransferase-like protein (isoleucine patch superfamily)